MRKFRIQVFFGLFFSAFIRFGFCFLFFLVGMLLTSVNKMFFYFGIGCLILQVVLALADAIYCMRATKKESGNPDLDAFFQVFHQDDVEDPEIEFAKALTKLTGGTFHGPEPEENIYLPLAEQLKEKIHEGITTKEAAEVFRELVESSGIENETIGFHSLVMKRKADYTKYFTMVYHLEADGHCLHFALYYKHTHSDPKTILEVICDEGREAFYKEVSDHPRFQQRADEVPLHIDVICTH